MELAKSYFADERKEDLKQLGLGLQRSDVPGHVTGKTAYFADRTFPGMLYLKMVRSPHDNARIKKVDLSEAEKHPGVHRILTHKDIPHNLYTILILIQVGPEVLAMAECDGQYIGRIDAHVGVPGDAGSPADVGVPGDAGCPADVSVPGDANPRAHVGALHHSKLPAHVGGTLTRATQTIPPAIRRLVFRRDGGKCRVPGCRHAVFTEPHHLNPRSEHGSHHPDNLCTLCSAHHLAVHEGRLLITGSASSVLRFTHADGTPYGGLVAPGVADARANAFQALRNLGFREGDAKRALAKVPPSVSSTQELVRLALRELVPQQRQSPAV